MFQKFCKSILKTFALYGILKREYNSLKKCQSFDTIDAETEGWCSDADRTAGILEFSGPMEGPADHQGSDWNSKMRQIDDV